MRAWLQKAGYLPEFSTQIGGVPDHVRATLKAREQKMARTGISPLSALSDSVEEFIPISSSPPTQPHSIRNDNLQMDDIDLESQSLLADTAMSLKASPNPEVQPAHPVWKVWCNNGDGCGLFSAGLTWFLLLWPDYILWTRILSPWEELWVDSMRGWIYFAMYQVVAGLAIFSHIKAMTTDPGSIPYGCLPIEPPPEGGLYPSCNSCAYNYKPPRAHRQSNKKSRCAFGCFMLISDGLIVDSLCADCSVCKRCISKMDHHCPWINNCVGVGNLKFFFQFCIYTCLTCIFVFSLIFTRVLGCPSSNISMCFDVNLVNVSDATYRAHAHAYSEDSAWSFVLVILLVMECFLFGIFTLMMTITQISAVSEDETQIESWQKQRDSRKKRPPIGVPQALPLAAQAVPIQANGATQPLQLPNSNDAGGSSTGHVSVTLPVAQPLPPTTMTRSRNCRRVFVGTSSSSTVATTSATNCLCHRAHSHVAPNFVMRCLLCIPTFFCQGSFLHFLLPTDISHDDYARLCNYRLPAPGVSTIINVVDTSAQQQRRQV